MTVRESKKLVASLLVDVTEENSETGESRDREFHAKEFLAIDCLLARVLDESRIHALLTVEGNEVFKKMRQNIAGKGKVKTALAQSKVRIY